MHLGGQRTSSSSFRGLVRFRRRAAALTAAVAAVGGLLAPAVSADTWDGGGADANWATNENWADDSAPVGGDSLLFAGTVGLTNVNNLPANTEISGITFDASAGAFTLNNPTAGSPPVAVPTPVVLTGDLLQNSAANQTINIPIVLNSAIPPVTDPPTPAPPAINIGGTGTGGLTLGQVTFGVAPQAATASRLNIGRNTTIGNLLVQTRTAAADPANVIDVAAGSTLSLTGPVAVGTPSSAGNVITLLNVTGGGTINATNTNNSNFVVGVGNLNAGGQAQATLDMSAFAGNFTYSTGTTGTGGFYVGRATRSASTLRLGSGTNSITSDVLEVGNTSPTPGLPGGENNAGGTNRLFLGASTNTINTDTINVGVVKSAGVIDWQAGTGSVTVRAQDGVGRVNAVTIGNFSSGSAIGTASQVLLAGHHADVLANTVTIGRLAATGSSAEFNTVTHDTGTFDVNVLEIARNVSNAAPNGVRGSFVLGGASPNATATGVLNVNTEFYLGRDTNTTASSETQAVFTVNGGTANVNANIQVVRNGTNAEDLAVVNVAGGTLNMTGRNIGSATAPLTAFNLSGGTLANAARVHANAVTITNAPNVTGMPVYVLPAGGTLSSPGLTLGSGHGIEGGTGAAPATVAGNVTVNAGGYLDPGSAGVAGILALNNNLTLNNASTVSLDLSGDPSLGNSDRITVGGALTLNGTVNLDLGSLATSAATGQTYTLLTYTGLLTGNETNLSTGADGTRKTFTVVPTATTPNEVQVTVGGSGPVNVTWLGDDTSSWEVGGAVTNWDAAGVPEKFFNQDTVRFDDTSTNPGAVQVVGQLAPASVTVDAARNYTFAGSGALTGAMALTKNNSGTLTVTNPNTFTGGTTINAGVVAIGTGGSLGTGPIANSATLRIDRTDVSTVPNVISGGGTVEHNGTGRTALTGVNTYSGPTNVNAGIVTVGSAAAAGSSLGAIPGGEVAVNSGGTANLGGIAANNALNFGQKQFRIAGTGAGGIGAITNRNYVTDPTGGTGGEQQFNSLQRVALNAPATVGGPATATDHNFSSVLGRIDIRAAAPADLVSNTAVLDLNGHALTKIGNSFFGLVNTTVNGSGDIHVTGAGGTFSLEGTTRLQDDATSRVRVSDGAMFQVWNLGAAGQTNVTRPVVMGGGTPTSGAFLAAGGGVSTLGSAVELRGDLTIRPTNANNNNTNFTLAGNVSEDATPRKIVKGNIGVVTLSGSNSFTGGLDVNAGTIVPPATTTGTATVQLGSATALHPANVVSFGPAANFTSVLQLNGNGATVGGLRTTGGAGTSVVENANDAAATLTISNAADRTFAGVIRDGTGATTAGPLTVTKAGAGTQTLSAANTYTGGTNVAAGRLVAGHADALGTGTLAVANGATAQAQAGLPTAVSLPAPLGITATGATGGTLDQTDGALVVRHADQAAALAGHATVNGLVRNAFNEFQWNQPGITSSTVAADIAAGVPAAVGILLNNDGGGNALFYGNGTDLPQFEGRSVDGNAVLTKSTLLGDGDLNGTVDSVDFALFQAGYTGAAPYVGFAFGDYDYNGVIDSVDFGLFQAGYQYSQSNPTPEMVAFAELHHLSLVAAAVPEPTTFGLLTLAAGTGLLARRRRGRHG